MPCRSRSRGFTLIELMVTIAVLAILIAIAFPSFRSVIRSNRIATSTNAMIASLSLARSEAIKNTHGTGVCASSAGTACDGGSWGAGWMVWDDEDGDGDFGGNETVLRYTAGTPSIEGEGDALVLAFDPRGRNRANATEAVVLRPEDCGEQPLQRTIEVTATGQVRTKRETCQ